MAVDGIGNSLVSVCLQKHHLSSPSNCRETAVGLAHTKDDRFVNGSTRHGIGPGVRVCHLLEPPIAASLNQVLPGRAANIIWVSPGGGVARSAHGSRVDTVSLKDVESLIASAPPGTVVQLTPGTYRDRVTLNKVKEITIRGGPRVIFDGGVEQPEPPELKNVRIDEQGRTVWDPVYPAHPSPGIIEIKNSEGITIESLAIRNAWPNGVSIRDSKNVRITGLACEGGTNAIYAKGRSCSGIVVENSSWVQDPSGALWSSLDWQHVHHGRFNFYNGAFFQAKNIGGDVTIQNNSVSNAFNGVRIKSKGEGTIRDIVIQGNSFDNISDNAIEPESRKGGEHSNWLIAANEFEGFHGPLSFDGVIGKDFVIEKNTLVATERPRSRMTEEPSDLDYHNGTSAMPRFFKLKTSNGEGGYGPPKIEGMLVRSNLFVQSDYPIRLADTDFPPGTVIEDNKFIES
ncbi:hypothetical protein ACFL6C_05505 [Myxococcota bacterium]